MTTTITMKVIMAMFVLMNFLGLVINLTSLRVNNNNNNESTKDFYYAKALVSFPYNSTLNTQAKLTQAAVRPLAMKQRPQPNAPAFFVERSQLEVRAPLQITLIW